MAVHHNQDRSLSLEINGKIGSAGLYALLEERIAGFFPPIDVELGSIAPSRYTEADIQQISKLLHELDRFEWSRVPRIYTVLRRIGQLQLLDSFIEQGITDICLPFSVATLPQSLGSSSRAAFIRTQSVVLTKAMDLEKGELGEHRSFADDERLPFETKAILGWGANGQVDKVLSLLSFNEYARKRIRRRVSPEVTKAYERELQVLKRLNHHHTIELMGSYTDPSYFGLIMSPVADCHMGEFLAISLLSSDKRSLLRSFFGCLATGLSYLHDHQIRHKDIKPPNILVKGERVLLTDFGLSFDWSDVSRSETEGPTGRTLKYCAPEVAACGPRNSSSDIWSLGCVFLEMATTLKGEKLGTMDNFFKSYGSENPCFHGNPDAVRAWMERLKLIESECGCAPLEWVGHMLNHERNLRPGASQLVQTIQSNQLRTSSRVVFIGLCCKNDSMPFHGDIDLRGDSLMEDAPNYAAQYKVTREAPPKNRKCISSITKHSNRRNNRIVARKPRKPDASMLFNAIRSGDAGRLSSLINSQPDLNARQDGGATPLHWAARYGNEDVARMLLDSGAEADVIDKYGQTPLIIGAGRGHEPFVRLMLDRNDVDPNSKDADSSTPLFFAVENGHSGVVRMLLECDNIDPDLRDKDGSSPLSWASWRGHVSVVKLLLQHKGVDPDAKDVTWGRTPLSYAAEMGHITIVQLLLARDDVDLEAASIDGETPLSWAAFAGELVVVELLLQKGANPNAKDRSWGATPFSYAAERGHQEVVERLLDRVDVDINARDSLGQTPLLLAAAEGKEEIVRLLLQKEGIKPDAKDSRGRTALFCASKKGYLEIVKLLLTQEGVDPQSKDALSNTPLEVAKLARRNDVVNLLKKHAEAQESMSSRLQASYLGI
jgi:ankyrin repeat protein